MKRRYRYLATAIAAAAIITGPAIGAEDKSQARDLTSTIHLLGLPCGQVVKSVRQGSNDYLATCKDGNRYNVRLNPNGKVSAKKL